MRFTWDEDKDIQNQIKHGISFTQALAVFNGSEVIEFDSENSSYNEDRFKAYGYLKEHGSVVVIFVEVVDNLIRIISAYKV